MRIWKHFQQQMDDAVTEPSFLNLTCFVYSAFCEQDGSDAAFFFTQSLLTAKQKDMLEFYIFFLLQRNISLGYNQRCQ